MFVSRSVFRMRPCVCSAVFLLSLTSSVSAQNTLIDFGDDWTFFRGLTAPSDPVDAWTLAGFDDAAWETGATGIGYGDDDDATVLEDMQDGYLAVYFRKSFEIGDLGAVTNFILSIDYDDGFIAYVNGTEVSRANLGDPEGDPVTFETVAGGNHEAGLAEFFELDAATLVAGTNIIAIEVHNTNLPSSDFSFNARLTTNDNRLDCPTDLVCTTDTDGVTLSWTATIAYDSVSVLRNGAPIAGSPFAGDVTSVLDVGAEELGNEYSVIATIDGNECPTLTCMSTAEITLIDVGVDWNFFRGTEEPSDPVDAWTELGFDDAAWETGPSGIGYGDDDDATVLEDMEDNYLSVYTRHTFNLPTLDIISSLTLHVDYDDAFVAFINGVEVARSASAGEGPLAFDAVATVGHEANGEEDFDLVDAIALLNEGDNVLAIQVHNLNIGSSDLSLIPRLSINGCPSISGFSCNLVEGRCEKSPAVLNNIIYLSYLSTKHNEGTMLIRGITD
ncbi:MAG: hypothetical protein AAF517_16060, partial [Planctomycetota bacterium]